MPLPVGGGARAGSSPPPAPHPTPPPPPSPSDILLWNTFGESDNFALLRGHKNAVLELAWSPDGGALFSASADGTAAMWDAESGERTRSFLAGGGGGGRKGAAAKILNSVCAVGAAQLATAR